MAKTEGMAAEAQEETNAVLVNCLTFGSTRQGGSDAYCVDDLYACCPPCLAPSSGNVVPPSRATSFICIPAIKHRRTACCECRVVSAVAWPIPSEEGQFGIFRECASEGKSCDSHSTITMLSWGKEYAGVWVSGRRPVNCLKTLAPFFHSAIPCSLQTSASMRPHH